MSIFSFFGIAADHQFLRRTRTALAAVWKATGALVAKQSDPARERTQRLADAVIFLDDMRRGEQFLHALRERIDRDPAYSPDENTPFMDLHDEILHSHEDLRHWPYDDFTAAIGADIRESTGFTQWAETQRLAGDLLPPLSRIEPDHVADEYFQLVYGVPTRRNNHEHRAQPAP
jgi:hypothetical protein